MAQVTITLDGLTSAQEQKLLQLYTDAQGYEMALVDEPTLTRFEYLKRRLVRHLLLVARDQYKKEEATTAAASAQETFNTTIKDTVETDNL